jgi:hypothetical protein
MLQQSIQEFIRCPPIKKENGSWYFYDPIDKKYYCGSSYLYNVFKEAPDSLWIANMITHYRHNHISYWNKCWGNNGKRYRKEWFVSYEIEKKKVNERAKRQIIRKCWPYMKWHGITKESFHQLENTSEETEKVIDKYLTTKERPLW